MKKKSRKSITAGLAVVALGGALVAGGTAVATGAGDDSGSPATAVTVQGAQPVADDHGRRHGGHGADDAFGDDRGGRVEDGVHRHRGRGSDDVGFDDHGGRRERGSDDRGFDDRGGRVVFPRSAAAAQVDVSGPCDEAEHASDPRCTGVAVAGTDDDRGFYGRGFDDRGFDDRGFDDRGFDDRNFDDRGLDDRGFDDHGGHGSDDRGGNDHGGHGRG
jgi:hypothetical protein